MAINKWQSDSENSTQSTEKSSSRCFLPPLNLKQTVDDRSTDCVVRASNGKKRKEN
jgi:hypothetical protein